MIVALFLVIAATLFGLREVLGFSVAYLIAYGAFSLMAFGIAGTFLWLWYRQRQELSMGMALSWAGAAAVNGAWYLSNILGTFNPQTAVLLGIALYATGAIVHLVAFRESLRLHPFTVVIGPALAVAFSLTMYWLFK